MAPTIAIATCEWHPQLDEDNAQLLDALQALGANVDVLPWSAPGPGGWEHYDAVVIRETWDYSWRLDEFLRWTGARGARLHNPPAVVAWNADKRYLFDLGRAGIAVIAGEHLPPGAGFEPPAGRYVVKPTVSGGARDAAVYDETGHAAAGAHVTRLHEAGRDLLVQPYYDSVDREAETAVIFLDGRVSHCMRKGPLLALGEPPSDEPFRAEDMSRREADDDVLALAQRTWAYATARFGPLPYGRVDILRSAAGEPAVLELELIEPSLFLEYAPRAADALAAALLRRAGGGA
jgi:hypothetical protein